MSKRFKGKGRRPQREFVPLNENIRARTLRVIDENGDNLGEITKDEAMKRAQDAGLDLFVVSKNTDIPIAKILDYGKHKFQEEKKAKQTKKKQAGLGDVKEIKMSFNIDIGDYNTRLKHTLKFLELNKKVKLNITLRGREMQHKGRAIERAEHFLDDVMEYGHTDAPVKMMGRSVIVYITPGPDKKRIDKRKEQEDAQDSPELKDTQSNSN